MSWTGLVFGDITEMAINFTGTGGATDHYACIRRVGLFHATDQATKPWLFLDVMNIGLPQLDDFERYALTLCPNGRIYALAAGNGKSLALFTSDDPRNLWKQITDTGLPAPAYGFYVFGLFAASNSPGDGKKDILFFTGIKLYRSTKSGKGWTSLSPDDYDFFHDDVHCLTFFPESADGSIPITFVGCDGGIARSYALADPSADIGSAPGDFNEHATPTDSLAPENLNHGISSCAVQTYWCDPVPGELLLTRRCTGPTHEKQGVTARPQGAAI
jgi:hypothetical protein